MSHTLEIKAALTVDETTGTVTAIAWPFGSPDMTGDIITKGAFSGAVPPMPMLAFHDQATPVGVWTEITETARGLEVKGHLLIDDVPKAREVYALIKAGGIGGVSIGFKSTSKTPRPVKGSIITALDLKEISLVTVPAHPGATILTVKEARMADENTEITSTVEDRVATLETDVASIKESIATLQGTTEQVVKAAESIEKKMARPGILKTPAAETEDLVTKAFGDYLRKGDRSLELKTLTVSSDEQGGYLAPAEMSTEFVRDLVEFSPIRSVATVRTTSSPSVKYPKRTGITNALWEGETAATTGSEPAFGQTEIPIREVSTHTDLSNQLLADSAGVAEQEVRLAFAEDFGQKEGRAFVLGNGINEPEGILTNADVPFKVSGSASAITADSLIDLAYDLPAAYRAKGTWLMNGQTLAAVRKLKDGQNNYLWQPSYQDGQPERILGYPVVEAVDMPDIGAGEFPIVFGDLKTGYRIIDRLELSILVNPYLLATNKVTRIHGTRRTGAGVIQPKAIRKLKIAAS